MTSKHIGVGDALVEAGELTIRRMGRAYSWRREYGGTIERAILTTGAVPEEVLASALSRTYGLPAALREELAAADPDVVAALTAKERRRLRALPFRHEGNVLHVAVSDPRSTVLTKVLGEETGFAVKLFVTPEPVLEELLDWYERGAPPPPPARLGPAPSKPAAVGAGMPASSDPIDRLGRALVAEALRFAATEVTVGSDSRGAYVRTFYGSRPALTRRLSGALLVPLVQWFERLCRRPGGFVVEFLVEGQPSQRRRLELLTSSSQEAHLRLATIEAAKGP